MKLNYILLLCVLFSIILDILPIRHLSYYFNLFLLNKNLFKLIAKIEQYLLHMKKNIKEVKYICDTINNIKN